MKYDRDFILTVAIFMGIFLVSEAAAIAFLTSEILRDLLPRIKLYILFSSIFITIAFAIYMIFQTSMDFALTLSALTIISIAYLYKERRI